MPPRLLGNTEDPHPHRGSENTELPRQHPAPLGAAVASAPWMQLLRGTETRRAEVGLALPPRPPAAAHLCVCLRFVAARWSPSPQRCGFAALLLPTEKPGSVRGAPTGAKRRGATTLCAGGHGAGATLKHRGRPGASSLRTVPGAVAIHGVGHGQTCGGLAAGAGRTGLSGPCAAPIAPHTAEPLQLPCWMSSDKEGALDSRNSAS